MIWCFHKGEAACVSRKVISPCLLAFALMSSSSIHCKLITFLNHHQTRGSLKHLLFIVDFQTDKYFWDFCCFPLSLFLSFNLPSYVFPVDFVTLPIWLCLWCLSQIHMRVGYHVALWQAHSRLPVRGPLNPRIHTQAQCLSSKRNYNLQCITDTLDSIMFSKDIAFAKIWHPIILYCCKHTVAT